MEDEPLQLELAATLTEIPQANSLTLFVRVMEELMRGTHDAEQLSERLHVDVRTVQYYLEFGRWIEFLKVVEGVHVLTETGSGFAHSVPARGRLFAQGMFRQKLVQAINALKRDSVDAHGVEGISTREATERAIAALSDLADSTVERRASGVAHMLEAAYRPARIDWSTGQTLEVFRHLVMDFPGRTFLTSMATREFVKGREIRIGFPKQVAAFVRDHGHRLSASTWQRASYGSTDGTATWFGAVPVNETTVDVAERRGRDLRRLLVHCVPHVTLLAALLTWRDAARRPLVRVTQDMYGVRIWVRDREVGGMMEVLERFALALELVMVRGVPKALRHAPAELIEPGDQDDLLEVAVGCGILKIRDTAFEVMQGLEEEFRDAPTLSDSTFDRLKPLQAVLNDVFKV